MPKSNADIAAHNSSLGFTVDVRTVPLGDRDATALYAASKQTDTSYDYRVTY